MTPDDNDRVEIVYEGLSRSEQPEWAGAHFGYEAPDAVEVETFEHVGVECIIKFVPLLNGHWCGYARLPDPDLVTVPDDGYALEPEIEVWGGVTYGPDSNGWVGFDDGHFVSVVEYRQEDSPRDAVKSETKELAEQIRDIADAAGGGGGR